MLKGVVHSVILLGSGAMGGLFKATIWKILQPLQFFIIFLNNFCRRDTQNFSLNFVIVKETGM